MARNSTGEALQEARHATYQALYSWRRRLWAHADLTAADKLVVTALGDHFNIETAATMPSLPTVASLVRVTPRQTKKGFDKARRCALIDWTSGSGRMSSRYVLLDETGTPIPGTLERLGQTKSAKSAETGPPVPGTLEQGSGEPGTPVPPNYLGNLEENLRVLAKRIGPRKWDRLKEGLEIILGPPHSLVLSHKYKAKELREDYGPDVFELLPGVDIRSKEAAA